MTLAVGRSDCCPEELVRACVDDVSAFTAGLPLVDDRTLMVLRHACACSFTSPLRIPLGSTKSRSGSPRSNARSSPAAFSPRSRTWVASSVVTSTPTLPTLARSSRNTLTPAAACALTNSLRQSTSSFTWVEPASLPKALPTKIAPGTFSRNRLPGCGRIAVTPVRTSPPRIMVVCPTSTPETSVIASSGPVGRMPTFNPKSEARGRVLGALS
jgi:hypothetical protein